MHLMPLNLVYFMCVLPQMGGIGANPSGPYRCGSLRLYCSLWGLPSCFSRCVFLPGVFYAPFSVLLSLDLLKSLLTKFYPFTTYICIHAPSGGLTLQYSLAQPDLLSLSLFGTHSPLFRPALSKSCCVPESPGELVKHAGQGLM